MPIHFRRRPVKESAEHLAGGSGRRVGRGLTLAFASALTAAVLSPAFSQAQTAAPGSDSVAASETSGAKVRYAGGLDFQFSNDGPLAGLLVEGDASFRGQRATAWSQGDTKYLLLDGDAVFKLESYGFVGTRALIKIDPQRVPGRTIYHIAAYVENAAPLPGAGGGPVQAQAPRLLVTASTLGGQSLDTDLLTRADAPPAETFVADGLARMGEVHQRLSTAVIERELTPVMTPEAAETMLARRIAIQNDVQQYNEPPGRERPVYAGKSATPEEQGTQVAQGAPGGKTSGGQPGSIDRSPASGGGGTDAMAITSFAAAGQLNFSCERSVFDKGDANTESVVMLIGKVRAVYVNPELGRDMTLKCEKMVIFLAPGVMEGLTSNGDIPANAVRGVYLEDNAIISDGQFTVRAPRVYYDLSTNRAILLEAVFYAWNPALNIPLYMRADVMRQTSATTFEAKNATLTNSEFFQPHLAIRSKRLTVKQTHSSLAGAPGSSGAGGSGSGTSGGGGEAVYTVQGSGNTLRYNDKPFFWLPWMAGSTQELPLEYVSPRFSSDRGFVLETGWNLFSLFGQQAPDGVNAIGRLDYQGNHGAGFGADLTYDVPDMLGNFNGYFLPYDNGTDHIQGREDVEQSFAQRGFLHWQHRQYLPRDLELSFEAAYVTDPTFLDEFYPEQSETAKQYETSLYVKKQVDDWAVTLLAKYNLNDFLAQSKFLETPGYQTDKLPELGYYRVGKSLWDDRLTYYSENRLSWMRFRFATDTPSDLGFNTRWSRELFNMGPNTSFEDNAEKLGYPLGWRGRLDTRHEVAMPLKLSVFDVTPYVAGRVTAYDNDFEGYGDNNSSDQVRLWGQVGTRLHTQFSNVWDIDNPTLDLYQMRHIIEPHAEVFWSQANMNKNELPIYDPEVEGIAVGPGFRVGMTNTFQTKRGGPGRWRSVDWLTITTDFIYRSQEVDPEQPVARYFAYRPEYSTGGNHFHTELQWMVTDTFGVNGEAIYNLEDGQQIAYWRVGATVDHTPRLRTFINYNEIEELGSRLLNYGFNYQITQKWSVSFSHTLSFSDDDTSRDIEVEMVRRLPRWNLRIFASHDQISGDTTVGFLVEPQGLNLRQGGGPLLR